MGDDDGMSKKIDEARKNLSKALKKHAEIVGGSAVSLKKSQRASARVYEAAQAYAEVVAKKTGLASPFEGIFPTGLEAVTIASLSAERDKLSTKPIHTISDAS
jgi:hypothetical protein